MFRSKSDETLYTLAKPSRTSLGNRLHQYQLGEAALANNNWAKALKWFTLASLPRAIDNTSLSQKELRQAAELKLEEVRNKVALIELQHDSTQTAVWSNFKFSSC